MHGGALRKLYLGKRKPAGAGVSGSAVGNERVLHTAPQERSDLLARKTLFRSGRSANQRQAEQQAFLISAGCKLAQGYYFGEPISADRASALLQG